MHRWPHRPTKEVCISQFELLLVAIEKFPPGECPGGVPPLEDGNCPEVPGENRSPVVDNQTVHTFVNTPVAITLTGSDPDGDALEFSLVGEPASGIGTLLDERFGTYLYIPELNFQGEDQFSFEAGNGIRRSPVATVTVVVEAQQTSSVPVSINLESGEPIDANPSSIVVEDIDQNMFPDLITANSFSDNISILLNQGNELENEENFMRLPLIEFREFPGFGGFPNDIIATNLGLDRGIGHFALMRPKKMSSEPR